MLKQCPKHAEAHVHGELVAEEESGVDVEVVILGFASVRLGVMHLMLLVVSCLFRVYWWILEPLVPGMVS